jgi:ornithine cyclodeaminase
MKPRRSPRWRAAFNATRDHGEAGWAVRAGLVDAASLVERGALLAAPVAFGAQETVVADLTGVAIQDFEIAKRVWQGLPPA